MGDLAPDFQADREEEDHHQDVVDELLDRQVAREEDIHEAVVAVEMELDVGLQDVVIELSGERQIGQKHGDQHADHQEDALEPGLFGQTPAAFVEFKDTFVPGVDRNQSHIL